MGFQFDVNDRVRIVGDHPWSGSVGTIVARASGGALKVGRQWEVRLENECGQGCFAAESDLQLVRRRPRVDG